MDFFTMNINESNRLEQKLKALATTKKGDKKPRSQRSFDPNRSSYRIDKSIKIDQGIEVDPKSDNSENPYLQFSDEFTCANPNGISFFGARVIHKDDKKEDFFVIKEFNGHNFVNQTLYYSEDSFERNRRKVINSTIGK